VPELGRVSRNIASRPPCGQRTFPAAASETLGRGPCERREKPLLARRPAPAARQRPLSTIYEVFSRECHRSGVAPIDVEKFSQTPAQIDSERVLRLARLKDRYCDQWTVRSMRLQRVRAGRCSSVSRTLFNRCGNVDCP